MKNVFISFVLLFSLSGSLPAAEVRVAVASNFKYTLQKLAADFKSKTGHELIISSASSGKLYAQIIHGAPYDVFLSADEKRIDRLVSENLASAESAYVYALGKLMLVSNLSSKHDCRQVLRSRDLRRLAIANPKIAPYGYAARQVLEKMGLWQQLQTRIIMGENISQTFQFVSTKNADAGFVAQSMVEMAMVEVADNQMEQGKKTDDVRYACLWDVPDDMYSAIKQKMVVLKNSKNKQAVQAFVRYMRSADARDIIVTAGYAVLAD